DAAGGTRAEQSSLEQVLLPPETSRLDVRGCPDGSLPGRQTLQDADGRVERRHRRPERRPAVPSAIRQLVAQQAVHDPVDRLCEVGADDDHDAVDARFDFALEVETIPGWPANGVGDSPDRLLHPRTP